MNLKKLTSIILIITFSSYYIIPPEAYAAQNPAPTGGEGERSGLAPVDEAESAGKPGEINTETREDIEAARQENPGVGGNQDVGEHRWFQRPGGVPSQGDSTSVQDETPGGATVQDTTSPAIPVDVQTTQEPDGSITISNYAVADAVEYKINWGVVGTGGTFTTTETSYLHQGLSNGEECTYRVKAKDSAGNWSAYSESIKAISQEQDTDKLPTAPTQMYGMTTARGREGRAIAFDVFCNDPDGDAIALELSDDAPEGATLIDKRIIGTDTVFLSLLFNEENGVCPYLRYLRPYLLHFYPA